MSFTQTITIASSNNAGQIATTTNTYSAAGHAGWQGSIAADSTLIAAPGTVTPTPSASGGTLAAATYYYKVTAVNGTGETTASPECSTTTSGSTGSVALAWAAVPGATSYKIYRGTSAGAEDHYQTSGTNSFTDTGSAGTAGTVPTFNKSATYQEIDISFLHSEVVGYVGTCDQGVVILANSSTSPSFTVTLAANKQSIWNADSSASNPWSADVTKIYAANQSTTTAANLKLDFVLAE